MSRRTIYRIIAVAVILILAGVLFWIGKGHTLLLDNQEITVDGKTYQADRNMRVSVDGQKPILVKAGKRKKVKDAVAGPWHSITIELLDQDKQVEKTIEKKFSVSLHDMFLLSLPTLLAEDSNWIQTFEPPKRRR